jgi:hypothetical protein
MEKIINENFHNFENPVEVKLKAVVFGATGSVGRVKFIEKFLLLSTIFSLN